MTPIQVPSCMAFLVLLALHTLPQAEAAEPVPIANAAAQTLQAQAFDQALAAYERNHWPQGFVQLRDLGLQGHADAARMALQMARFGGPLYGQALVLTSEQSASLQQLQVRRLAGLVSGLR